MFFKKQKKSEIELTAQEAIDGLIEDMENPGADPEKREIVGIITDQDEAIKLLEWLLARGKQSK